MINFDKINLQNNNSMICILWSENDLLSKKTIASSELK